MTIADPRSQQLDELSQYAYRLGLVFGAAAERTEDLAGQLQYFQLFDRCFFSVRVAMSLQLRLGREPAAQRLPARAAQDDLSVRAERDPSERERSDAGRDRPERYAERDQERERETVSVPLLLRTLETVVADAALLPGPEPSALPSLRQLLARFTSPPTGDPGIAARSMARPIVASSGSGLRARLAGSATVPVMTLVRPAPPGLAVPPRRATGPPRR